MTRRAKPAHHLRRAPRVQTRVSAELYAEMAHRLTERDKLLIETVWEHRVLTTSQLAAIFYPSILRAQQRLRQLHGFSALLRFRPWTPQGSQPWHWVVGPAGAALIAAQRGITIRELGYKIESALTISMSNKLAHQIGVNQFFTDLHTHARNRNDATHLDQWWSERHCQHIWKGLARPDAFGNWAETQPDGQTQALEFFLEHDTGSVPLPRLISKLHSYQLLAEATKITTPVLFWLPSNQRETHLRRLLTNPPVPLATAVQTPHGTDEGPAGPIWLPIGTQLPRRRLATLANAWHTHPQPATPNPTHPGYT